MGRNYGGHFEFPHLSDRLKLQGLIQFMEEHPIAREEALAQLHRKVKVGLELNNSLTGNI